MQTWDQSTLLVALVAVLVVFAGVVVVMILFTRVLVRSWLERHARPAPRRRPPPD